jgi:hypothetical protein
MRRSTRLAGAALVAFTLIAGATVAVAAPEIDPTARYDIDDILGRHASDVENLPTQEEAQGRPVTFSVDLSGTYTTNAGTTVFAPTSNANNAVGTGYVTPSFTIDVTPITLAGWNVGAGAQLESDFYGGSYNNRFGEGRAEGVAFADRPVGPGTLTAEAIYLATYSNDFTQNQGDFWIGDLDYDIKLGPLNADFAAQYQGTTVVALRRARVSGSLAYTVPGRALGYEISLEADLLWSHFDAGPSIGRQDLTAAGALVASRRLGNGWSLDWKAAYVNRMSNRPLSRFDALDLVAELGKRF